MTWIAVLLDLPARTALGAEEPALFWLPLLGVSFQVGIVALAAIPFLVSGRGARRLGALLTGVTASAVVLAISPWAVPGGLLVLVAGLLAALRPAPRVVQNAERGSWLPQRAEA